MELKLVNEILHLYKNSYLLQNKKKMDIEPTTMGGRKTLDLIQKNDMENRLSIDGNEASNKSTFFEHIYFWSIFLLSTSFFLDLTVYFCFYQKRRSNEENYQARTFFIRVITDVLFISPLLIFLRFALDNVSKNYIIGIFIFLPQFILNLISIIDIHIQEFVLAKENGTNTTDNDDSDSIIPHNDTIFNIIYNFDKLLPNDDEKLLEQMIYFFCDVANYNESYLNDIIDNYTNDTTNNETNRNITMTTFRKNILKFSPSVNMIIYIITVLLTYFRVYKN